MEDFLTQIKSYYPISEETGNALMAITELVSYKKNDVILKAGDMARYYYFVRSGLLGYHTVDESGDIIFKLFFEEYSFAASTAAIVDNKPSKFYITALEECELLVYPAQAFRELLVKHHDLALFHIHYLERNWVVKKEPLEIKLKWDTAKTRYVELYENQKLYKRLKQHHIASYLGVTPTQLSRIRKELNS